MIWQCQDCNSLGFYWTDEERDAVIEQHKNCGSLGITVCDETELAERPYNHSVGPTPDVHGWTPHLGTPDTGLNGGTPDNGRLSHPQFAQPVIREFTRAEIIADLLRAWDEVKKEINL